MSVFFTGCGPRGLGSDEKPLPLATRILGPAVRTQVGYQPVGMKPREELLPGVATSNTARQLLSALAMYSVFSSGDSASPFGVEPASRVGYRAVEMVSSTFQLLASMTDTELSLALATNRNRPLRV